MRRTGSFEERARAEVERIKGERVAEEERKQARMRELAQEARGRREAEDAEERRRRAERDAKLRGHRETKAQATEAREKRTAFNTWVAQGGKPDEFEAAWPEIRAEMLKARTLSADSAAREAQRQRGPSRI